jgi:hypothetical protein
MTVMTEQQLDALYGLRREVGATQIATHELADPHRLYVVMWIGDTIDVAWRGTISPAGHVRNEMLVTA